MTQVIMSVICPIIVLDFFVFGAALEICFFIISKVELNKEMKFTYLRSLTKFQALLIICL